MFFHSRTANAGDACCFVDSSIDYSQLLQKCEQFQTNVILCDVNTMEIIRPNGNVIAESVLFDECCYFVQLREVKVTSEERFVIASDLDVMTSSRVFFYASTSGSCGEIKSIGVTFKCFMPNIEKLA